MKLTYTFFTVSLLTLASLAQAQIKKGTILVGGSIQYKNNKIEQINSTVKQKSKTFEIGPTVGLAVKDNLVIGINLSYGNNKTDEFETNSYSGHLFLRKYWNINSKFYAFAQADGGYGLNKGESTNEPGNPGYAEAKGWSISGSLIPGIAYAASSKVQLEATFLPLLNIGYSKTNYETRNGSNNISNSEIKHFNASSSLTNAQQFSLGVRFLL